MTLKNNRASLLCYSKLCVKSHNHRWSQTQVRDRNRPIRVKIDNFWSHVTLKFYEWPWKTIGHLYYATSSIGLHFTTIGEFKLELQYRNTRFGSKSAIFFVRPDLQIWWMISKTIGHLFYATSSFVHHFLVICKFQLEFRSGNDQIGAKFVLISVTLTFDLWPCPSAWTFHVSLVINPGSFMMIRSEEHSEKGVTDTQTHRQTHRQAHKQTDGRTKVFLELLGRS